jgi:actin-related protein
MVVFGGDELCSMVLDVGRDTIKAGLSGDDLPRSVFPAIHIAGSEGENQIG